MITAQRRDVMTTEHEYIYNVCPETRTPGSMGHWWFVQTRFITVSVDRS